MSRRIRLALPLALLALLMTGLAPGDSPGGPDLSGYKTVEAAVTTSIRSGREEAKANSPAYLGILLESEAKGGPVVASVDPDSPAAKAGIRPGDVLLKLDGRDVKDGVSVMEVLGGKSARDGLEIALSRQDKPTTLRAILAPWSKAGAERDRTRPGLGLQVAPGKEGEGVAIERVVPGSVADRAKLKVGEVLLKVDGVSIAGPDQLRDLIAAKPAESTVMATLLLAEKAVEMKLKLDPDPPADGPGRRGGGGGGGGIGGGGYWTKPGFRLAIICVEYPDMKHNAKITKEAWDQALFSEGTYNKTNVTGQAVQGSFRDYFLEQSYGYFKVEGKVFDWVEASKKRADYATGNRMALLTESLDKVLERDGKDALKDFDGVFFVYAGGRYPAPRGSLYWPHRSSVSHKGKRWPYFIIEEGGPRMQGLSVLCHEFGHMLGLPDLYARPENPGMEGLGVWCCMSQQPNRSAPQHFSAWAKEKVGWIKPVVVDPAVKQKLILAPIEDSSKDCVKVLVRPDGSEYILLENRKKTKFDKSLPAEGLLIWHVLGNRPSLIESHGIAGPVGPRVFMSDVPYPSVANDAYTPYTTPSSRSPLGGGRPVHITNIRRLDDGRISFQIGYEYQ
jgi:M6 family metalloprotease-like protein